MGLKAKWDELNRRGAEAKAEGLKTIEFVEDTIDESTYKWLKGINDSGSAVNELRRRIRSDEHPVTIVSEFLHDTYISYVLINLYIGDYIRYRKILPDKRLKNYRKYRNLIKKEIDRFIGDTNEVYPPYVRNFYRTSLNPDAKIIAFRKFNEIIV